jgi:hypothetical protein
MNFAMLIEWSLGKHLIAMAQNFVPSGGNLIEPAE